ncbi:hypothetical protein DPMN_125097 [Dreissena polymorpha]|uniref:Uncharacterized protein n=1 Tax=Dreissena polymorpha TaxID=45954 RepID=A0A9D4GUN6_DREPO|nr:hypothetical protein DPMN_125097 [Dreissena polymorpha]
MLSEKEPTGSRRQKFIHLMFTYRFIRLLNRGKSNSCSRCDLMFKPFPDSKLARKREHSDRKPASSSTASSTPAKDEIKVRL